MQKSFEVMGNSFEISRGYTIQNLNWSMLISFHQSSNHNFWLKQQNKASASFLSRTFMKKAYEVFKKTRKNGCNVWVIKGIAK